MAKEKRDGSREFEDLSSYSSAREYKKRPKNRRAVTVAWIAGLTVCLLLLAVGCVMIYVSTDLLEGLTTTDITKDPAELGINLNDQSIVMDDSIKNIALFGVDSRTDESTGQSDVIMILTVDNKHKKIKMTSVLRDSRVPIEGETLDGDTLNWETKINAAYAYGGPELAIRTLNLNFGLDITDYVTVNFANMAVIVDAFGGIDMEVTAEEVREINRNLWNLMTEVERRMEQDRADGSYEQHSYVSIGKDDFFHDSSGGLNINSGNYVGGTLHLNGNQAVAYGRIRYLDSDFGRVDRQQKVLRALIQKAGVLSFSDYPGLIKELMPYCETSFELDDVIGLTPVLTGDFAVESIKVPNQVYETDLRDETIENVDYLVYDLAPAAKRISSFIYEELSPYWAEYGNTAESPGAGM